jgi:2-methylcitrate dehydratase
MSAFSRNLCSTASRSLRQRSSVLSRAVRPIALRTPLSNSVTSRTATATAFSTMSSLKSSAPPVQSKREFDPEIKDIASYVHNTKIDSELAVWTIKLCSRILANFTLV